MEGWLAKKPERSPLKNALKKLTNMIGIIALTPSLAFLLIFVVSGPYTGYSHPPFFKWFNEQVPAIRMMTEYYSGPQLYEHQTAVSVMLVVSFATLLSSILPVIKLTRSLIDYFVEHGLEQNDLNKLIEKYNNKKTIVLSIISLNLLFFICIYDQLILGKVRFFLEFPMLNFVTNYLILLTVSYYTAYHILRNKIHNLKVSNG